LKKAAYPERSCRIPVPGDWIDHPCEVREHHPGPCASLSVPRSVTARDIWEAANPGWESLSTMDDPFREAGLG
jgi:hypothetical protein